MILFNVLKHSGEKHVFITSKLATGEFDYIPKLIEVAPEHFVAEHDALEEILAMGAGLSGESPV